MTEERFRQLKALTDAGLSTATVSKATERSAMTVMLVARSATFAEYKQNQARVYSKPKIKETPTEVKPTTTTSSTLQIVNALNELTTEIRLLRADIRGQRSNSEVKKPWQWTL